MGTGKAYLYLLFCDESGQDTAIGPALAYRGHAHAYGRLGFRSEAAEHSRARVQLNRQDGVRHQRFEFRLVDLVVPNPAEDGARAADGVPGVGTRPAVRARRGNRVTRPAAVRAALEHELTVAQPRPEGFRVMGDPGNQVARIPGAGESPDFEPGDFSCHR